MQKGMLITLPKYDDATEYLTHYSKSIIKEAKSKNFKVKEVHKGDLNLKKFSEIVEKLDFRFVMFNGHGSKNSLFGYKQNIIVEVGKNEKILKERIIYARACDAGSNLGLECMKNTTNGCFIGYKFPFAFYMDKRWSAKPHNDNTAKLFLEPSNSIPLSLIKGNSAINAHENSKKQILKNIKRIYLRKRSEPGIFHILEGLWNNFLGQIIEGNESAKI